MRAPWLLAFVPCGLLWAQGLAGPCSCGANPPALKNRELKPYAETPPDMRPYRKFDQGEPYYEFYTKLIEYNGGAREVPTLKPADVEEVRVGFLGPIENHPDEALGRMMLAGTQLAIEEANAGGGYGGKPFKLMVHNDQAVWGASSNEIVKMGYDEKVWGMLGSLSGDSTHIGLRVILKAEFPMVNSAATDPTIPETIIPWYLTTIQDDRVQSYTLARRIYTDLGLQRVALLRINDRYGRFGVVKFKDVSRRMGHPVVLEQKYFQGDSDFRRQLRIIKESKPDAVVLWGDAKPAGIILKQMREMGMTQRVFGSFRTLAAPLFEFAGSAAEGFEAVYPFDPTRDDPQWLAFRERFKKRFNKEPEVFASLAYDAMNILLQSICKAGLNRGKIRDALTGTEGYKGVTGPMTFDPNCKNIHPLYLAAVKNGKIEYRAYPMDKEYAHVGAVQYNGPPLQDSPAGPLRIGLFGPGAEKAAAQLARLLEPYQGRYELVPISADAPWGKASTALVDLLYRQNAIGLLSTDRNSSHLAEQIAIKAFVPLVALSADKSLTSVNIPWIFRLPPETALEDALGCLLQAAEKSGPNRGRLREVLASGLRFDSRGEPAANERR